jgi:hypothetical protein
MAVAETTAFPFSLQHDRSPPLGQEDTRRRTEPAGGRHLGDRRCRTPGFIDTRHHRFETALRRFLADDMIINAGSGAPCGGTTYYAYGLLEVGRSRR